MVVVHGDDLEAASPTEQVPRADLDLGAGDEPIRVR